MKRTKKLEKNKDGKDLDDKIKENFLLLSDETRLDIVQFLRNQNDSNYGEVGSSYSEIKKGIDIRDNGTFNYHLNKLLGNFVEESDSGYSLKYGSETVIQAMISTIPPSDGVKNQIKIDSSCLDCGGELVGIYEGESFRIRCKKEKMAKMAYPFPPGALEERSDEELLKAFDQRLRKDTSLAKNEVCPYCSGKVEKAVLIDPELPLKLLEIYDAVVEHMCIRCNFSMYTGAAYYLFSHPELIDLHKEHGIYIPERPVWEIPLMYADEYIESRNPLRIKVELDFEDQKYVFVVDRSFDIVERTRIEG